MNIGERAVALVHQFSREQVLMQARGALDRVVATDAAELVPGADVALLVAAAILRNTLNGTPGPRVVTRVLSDGCALLDGVG